MKNHFLFRSQTAAAALTLLLAAGPTFAAGVSVDDASWADTNEATQKYKSGKRAYDQGKLEEALARFRDSYDTVASPNSHLMVARVLIELKRYVAAYDELALVIEEAETVKKKPEKYTKTADAARALRKDLEEKLGFVEVEVPARVTIKGEEVPPSQWGTPIPVVAGAAAVEVEMADGTKRTEEVTVAAGKTSKLAVTPPQATAPVATPTDTKGCPSQAPEVTTKGTVKQTTVGYVSAGVGAAGLLTFTIFGILDNKKFNELDSDCTGGVCPPELADDAEKGRSFQALANVGLGVGVIGIGTGAVLLLTAPRDARTASHRAHPRLLVGPGSVTVKGTF
jgi:hypothetical protein